MRASPSAKVESTLRHLYAWILDVTRRTREAPPHAHPSILRNWNGRSLYTSGVRNLCHLFLSGTRPTEGQHWCYSEHGNNDWLARPLDFEEWWH